MIEISVQKFNKYRMPTAYVKISVLMWKVQLLSTSFTALFRAQNRVEITKVHFRLPPTSSWTRGALAVSKILRVYKN